MLSKRHAFGSIVMAVGIAFALGGARARADETNRVEVKARIVRQFYCRGDADTFTVNLDLDVTVTNISKDPLFFKRSMIPWVTKVARNVADAQSGRFLFEMSGMHVSDPRHLLPSDSVWVAPGKSVTFQSGCSLVARYDPTSYVPGSISAGSYALVLNLAPEIQFDNASKSPLEIGRLVTEAFTFEVDSNPHLITCSKEFPKRPAAAVR